MAPKQQRTSFFEESILFFFETFRWGVPNQQFKLKGRNQWMRRRTIRVFSFLWNRWQGCYRFEWTSHSINTMSINPLQLLHRESWTVEGVYVFPTYCKSLNRKVPLLVAVNGYNLHLLDESSLDNLHWGLADHLWNPSRLEDEIGFKVH